MSYAALVGYTAIRDQTGSAVFYTPPIAREATKAVFSLQTTHFVSAGAVVVTVEHKDFADTLWATADAFADITAAGVKTLAVSGLMEELRFKIAFSGGNPLGFAHIVLAEVTWLSD
jgi:hypothetical protein